MCLCMDIKVLDACRKQFLQEWMLEENGFHSLIHRAKDQH